MSRYIDAELALQSIPSEEMISKMVVANAPYIDIVRCGECKHRVSGRMGKMCYGRHPDDFCSYGERNE